MKVIKKEFLPKATVLVTSQPSRTLEDLKSDVVMNLIHVKGFDKVGIEQFIRASKQTTLSDYPQQITTCFHIPVVLRIVAYLASQSAPDTLKRPSTITEVYESLIENISLAQLNSCLLYKLGELAWEGICKNNFIFSNGFETSRLMEFSTPEGPYCKMLPPNNYRFIHQTVQEFLAANFIRKLSTEEMQKIFKEYSCHPMLSGTMVFLAGLTGQTSREPIQCRMSTFNILHQIHEAGSEVTTKESKEVIVSTTFPQPFPHDMLALGYCIGKSHALWRLGFTLRNLTKEHIEMLALGIGDKPTGKIKELNFSLNDLGNEGVKALLKIRECVLDEVVYINIRGNGLGNGFALPCLPKNVNKFLFHDNKFGQSEQEDVIEAVCKSKCLQHVSFSNLSPCECEKLLTRSDQSLGPIELYQLQSDSVAAALQSLSKSKVRDLQIYQSKITTDHIQQLHLVGSSLTKLELVNCAITSEAVQYIASAVEASKIECLNLNNNLIDDKATPDIEQLLSSRRLKSLKLHDNPFTLSSAKRFVTCTPCGTILTLSTKWSDDIHACMRIKFE